MSCEEVLQPSCETCSVTISFEEVDDELPSNRVECLSSVKLEQKSGRSTLVESMGKISDVHEVIMNSSILDEGALGIRDEVIHMRSQPYG